MADRGYVYAGVTKWREGTHSGVFRARVGEYEWTECNTGFPDVVHVQTVVVHPTDPATLFAGTNDGPYRSRNRGDSWERMEFPERGRQIWSIHFDPTNPKTVFAGASPVEVFKSEDGGDSWRSIPSSRIPPAFDTGKFVNRVMRMAVDPSNPKTVFGGSEVNGMLLSWDGGETWKDGNAPLIQMVKERPELESAILTPNVLEGMFDIHAIASTRAAPDSVFTAARMGIFCSRDKGVSWEDLNIQKSSPYSYGRDIKVSPQDPKTIYVCVSVASHGNTGGVFKSTDIGKSWTRFDHSVEPQGTMMGVALHPTDADIVHAATRAGQVFATLDGGRSWSTHKLPDGCKGVYSVAVGG
jgi:photosystem II stability/assembly factor-like uncharacterized protein